mgnify:CR=1 FL=1
MGNALIASLLQSLDQRGVPVLTRASLERIERDGEAISAIEVSQADVRRRLRIKGGLILASGGFNRHPERRKKLLGEIDVAWCPAIPARRTTWPKRSAPATASPA